MAEDWRPTRFDNGMTPAEKLALAPELERMIADPAWPIYDEMIRALVHKSRAIGFADAANIQFHIGYVEGLLAALAVPKEILEEAKGLLRGAEVRAAATRERGFESGGDLSF